MYADVNNHAKMPTRVDKNVQTVYGTLRASPKEYDGPLELLPNIGVSSIMILGSSLPIFYNSMAYLTDVKVGKCRRGRELAVRGYLVSAAKKVMFLLAFVCLFVSRIMQKLLNRCSHNSAVMWYMGRGRNR